MQGGANFLALSSTRCDLSQTVKNSSNQTSLIFFAIGTQKYRFAPSKNRSRRGGLVSDTARPPDHDPAGTGEISC